MGLGIKCSVIECASGYAEWAMGVHREEKESSLENLNDMQKLAKYKGGR